MTEGTGGLEDNSGQGWLKRWIKSWPKPFHKETAEVKQETDKVVNPTPEALKVTSGLYKVIEGLGEKGSVERRVIEYPFEVLYGDFKAVIKSLKVGEELKGKIETAFDEGNLGIALRITDLWYFDSHHEAKKTALAKQLRHSLEPLVIAGNINSPEAQQQRNWIRKEATWDDLLTGVFQKPTVPSLETISSVPNNIANQLSDVNLDPNRSSK